MPSTLPQQHIRHLLTWGLIFKFIFFFFFLFILSTSFLNQEYWSGSPVPSRVGHIFSELSTMTCHSCVSWHGMAHSFTKLQKPIHPDKVVIHEGDKAGISYCKVLSFQTSKVVLPNLPMELFLLEI